MEYLFDQSVWTDQVKILTDQVQIVPGLEMFGHNCAPGHLRLLPPHIHKTSEFLYLANGNQKYYIGEQEYLLSGNQLLIVDNDVLHSTGLTPFGRHESLWFRLDIPVFADSLGLDAPFGELVRQRLQNRKDPILSLRESLYGDLQAAFYNLASADLSDRLLGYAQFLQFITQLIKSTDPATAYSQDIQQVISYIGENIRSHLTLEELAGLAGLSLSGFKQKFRRETGISPREYINLLKIEKAKEYLAAGVSVTETAFALDFSSSSYFSVLFRQVENQSPGDYARLHKYAQTPK